MTIIAGNAFPDTHEEIQEAMNLDFQLFVIIDFLGDFMKRFTSIAVTGAHGKTSTTGLLAHVMDGAKPTSYLIGDGTGKGNEKLNILCLKHVNIEGIFFLIFPIMLL